MKSKGSSEGEKVSTQKKGKDKGKDKVALKVFIDKELYERLKLYIAETHPKLYGGITKTIEDALREYLDKHQKP